MRIKIALCVLLLCNITYAQVIINGHVNDENTGEALIGVSVYTSSKKSGTITNAYGYYNIVAGTNDSIYFQYMGYTVHGIKVTHPIQYNVKLSPASGTLEESEIVASRYTNSSSSVTINLKQLNTLPAMGGERDLIKALQLVPGIKKGADGTASMLVRGGAADHNLILLDDAPVYNPSHLLGFFSLFNTDAIKSATLQTGGFSANYGGRLSSVLDIHTLNGNREHVAYSASVGLLASRASLQIPLFKGKGSIMSAGRISYVNKLFELAGKDLPFFFYDFNTKINYQINNNHQLFFIIYNGDDILKESEKSSSGNFKINSQMGNRISSLRWTNAFKNKKQFSTLTLFTSSYRYKIDATLNESHLNVRSDISDIGMRYNIQHYVNNHFSLAYGAEFTNHVFKPNSTTLTGSFNENIKEQASIKRTLQESAAYISAMYKLNRFLFNPGLRYSSAQTYSTVYTNPEPRLKIDYQLSSSQTIFTSYAKMVQYMFLLSSSSAILPTDVWYGVSKGIKPQQAHIISLGYQYSRHLFDIRAEAYYKPMQNLVEYKEGTIDMVNGDIGDKTVQGKGKAYGVELTTKFTQNRFNIILGYTLSWSNRTFNELNNSKAFLARYDRRHDLSITAYYELNKRVAFSSVWCYATGSRFTAIVGQFMMPDGNYTGIDFLPVYSGRNAVRLSASHRLDANIIIKNKASKKYRAEWHVGAYNIYNQTQPYRIKMQKNQDGSYTYKQTGLFGFIPSIAYQLTF